MSKIELKEMVDIPEVHEIFHKCIYNIADGLTPVMKNVTPDIFLNSLVLYMIDFISRFCNTQENLDFNIEQLCESLKINSKTWFKEDSNDASSNE